MLTVDHVTKRYGNYVAVGDVSFKAEPGRILGLLGPNGAGKTSTIRMITYITIPDEGEVRFDGKPVGPWSQERMGYLPEERGLYKKMKVEEQLLYFAELRGLSRAQATEKVHYWLSRLGAADWGSKKTQELSKGMQQKVQFIGTLLHDPDLLIFDEPFSGLDPINADLLKDIVLELRDEGRTVLFASHRMEQVEQLCDDICLISKGQIVLQGPLREVKSSFGQDTVRIEFEGDVSFLGALEQEGRVRILSRSHHRAEIRLLKEITSREILERTLAEVADVYRFELVEPPLTEIFVQAVQGENGGVEEKRRRGGEVRPQEVQSNGSEMQSTKSEMRNG